MLEAKFPPPKPESSASTWNTQSGVLIFCNAMPAPTAGNISSAVVKAIVLRPPHKRMKKLEGILKVAPVKPAMAIKVNSSDCSYGNPRFSICTVSTPHCNQTPNPQSKHGMDIQRLRVATELPVVSQNSLSSTSHFFMSDIFISFCHRISRWAFGLSIKAILLLICP